MVGATYNDLRRLDAALSLIVVSQASAPRCAPDEIGLEPNGAELARVSLRVAARVRGRAAARRAVFEG